MSSFLFFLCVIVTLSVVAQSLNEEEVSDWETDDVIEWLKNGGVSERSVEYIVEEQKISDGAELLYLRDDPESRQRVHERFPKKSDQIKFDRLLDELLSQIAAVESGDESVQSDNKAKEDANAYDVVDHADAADNDDDDDDDADDSIHDVSTSKKKKKKKAKKKSEQSSLSSDGQDIVFDAKLEIEAAHSNQSSLSLANSSEKVKTHAKSSKKSKRKSITKKPSKRKYNDTSKYDRKYEHRNNNDNDKDDDDTFDDDDDERKRNDERDDGAIDDGTTEIENERDVDASDAREQQSERERAISEHVFDESGNQVVAVVEPDSESKSKKYDAIERDEASSAKYGKYSKYNKYGKYDVVKDETELDDGVQEANENRLDDERFPAGQGGVVDIGTLLLQLKQYCALHEHGVCACLDAANKDDSHGDDLERQKALFMPHDDAYDDDGDDTNTDTDSGDKDDEDDDDGDSLVGAGENELHDDFNGDSKADSGEEDAETEMADDELKAPRLVDMERQTPNKSVSEAVDDVFVLPEAVEHVIAEKQELDTDTSTADDSGEDDDDDDDDEETEDEDVDEWKLRPPANKQQIDDDDDESGVRPVRSDKTLNVTYWTKDVVNNGQELKQEIVFNIGGKPKIDGILHLKWCLLELKERYCSEQTFLRGARQLHTTILTNVAYDFTIYDEQREYVWSLDAYSDNQPEQDDSMAIEIMAQIPPDANPSVADLQEALNSNGPQKRTPLRWTHSVDTASSTDKIYVSASSTRQDKLMAEKIRSILFDVYKANTVEVSQKVDANSFASLESDSGWSSSTNSTLFFLCAMVLCGGAFIASQKKFAFKYQSVYSNLKKRSSLSLQHDAIDGEQERELNVDAAASQTSSSAEQFLQSVFKELGIPSFITSKNFHSLRDAYVTTVEQLRNFDDGDWKRHGFQAKHIEVIKNKLHDEQQHTSNDTDDNAVDDKDDSDIPDMSDNDGDKPTKGAKNDSTNADTDFDDFTDF